MFVTVRCVKALVDTSSTAERLYLFVAAPHFWTGTITYPHREQMIERRRVRQYRLQSTDPSIPTVVDGSVNTDCILLKYTYIIYVTVG